MSNPRLMAEDVANHYMEKISQEFPHSQNIRRHLRSPLLAVTRRILLPRIDYATAEQNEEVGTFGGDFHSDPTVLKCKEGLDWRDYVSLRTLSTDKKSETEVSDSEDNQRVHQYYGKRQPDGEAKLSRRSVARMEAFLASCAAAIPENSFYPQTRMVQNMSDESNEKSQVMKSLQSFASNFSSNKPRRNVKTATRSLYQQINMEDLTVRLELYIRSLRRIHGLRQQSEQKSGVGPARELIECIVHYESPRALRARIQILVASLINRTNSVGSMRPILKKLLTYLTRELLAVEHLDDELNNHITKIALEYEHLTSFASLAFLSSPENSAETNLAPLLYNYVEYLRNEWELCVDKCQLETSLARAIHPGMRHVFKTSEFQSIGHLLEVCNGYRDQLDNIIISSRDYDPSDTSEFRPSESASNPDVISSAASGDEIDVKKCNAKTTKAIKQALRDLRREIITVNGHLLPPARTLTELVKLLRERLHSRTVKLKEKKAKAPNGREHDEVENVTNRPNQADSDSSTSKSSLEIEMESSGNEADIDGISGRPSKMNGNHNDNTGGNKSKRRHFNVEAIDIMTRRLLIAASRTRIGGDAYFVVRDLFGGDGVEVIASTSSPMGPYSKGKISPTIELSVRLASIMIKCHSTFNVFPEPYSGDREPLIQLRTTTTEIIDLQEVRIGEDGHEFNIFSNKSNGDEHAKRRSTKLMLREKKTENSGRKILSVRPAKYERIDNWHTPS